MQKTQADAYKKYVLLCLKVHGEVKALPVYTSHILQRYSKSASTSVQPMSLLPRVDPQDSCSNDATRGVDG